MEIPGGVQRIQHPDATAFFHPEAAGFPVAEGFLGPVDGPLDSNQQDRPTTRHPALKEADDRPGTMGGGLEFLRPAAPRESHREGDVFAGLEVRHPIIPQIHGWSKARGVPAGNP